MAIREVGTIVINQDDEDEFLSDMTHVQYFKRALVYCLVKYVPGMRLDLTAEEFDRVCVQSMPNVSTHFHIEDGGDRYIAEVLDGQTKTHESRDH